MLDIAGRIADINEQQLNAGNERVVGSLLKFQTRLSLTPLAALAIGLGMAVFSTRHILHLEAGTRLRYEEIAEARRPADEPLGATRAGPGNRAAGAFHRTARRSRSVPVGRSGGIANLSIRLDAQSLHGLPAANVETIRGLVEGTVRVVRNMALLLRPSMLDDLGLVPALRWQAREISQTHFHGRQRRHRVDAGRSSRQFKTCRLSRRAGSARTTASVTPAPPPCAFASTSRTMPSGPAHPGRWTGIQRASR